MQPNEKSILRQAVRARFPGMEARDAESRALCDHLLAWEPFREARVIGGYLPLPREADVTPLLLTALREGRTLALPRCEDGAVMTFRRVDNLSSLPTGRWGFPEPAEDAPLVDPEAIDLLLVPLEALDPSGRRLGKGGGYYDRYLPRTQAVKVGCVLRHQRVPAVPSSPHDVALPFACDADGIHAFY